MGSVMTTRPLGKTSFCTLCVVSVCAVGGMALSILAWRGQRCHAAKPKMFPHLVRMRNSGSVLHQLFVWGKLAIFAGIMQRNVRVDSFIDGIHFAGGIW